MSDVVDLSSRRDENAGFKTCLGCGSAYFYLLPFSFESSERTHGRVTVGPDLSIDGWNGRLVCSDCGAELVTPMTDYIPPPRAVE